VENAVGLEALDVSTEAVVHSILVVDDSLDNLLVQRIVLEKSGYTVFTAQSGGEALEVLDGDCTPDLILLDMQMEDMTGLDFLQILEEKKPEIFARVPVVFVSGTEKVPTSKAIGFIRKPYDLEKFLSAVRSFLLMGTSSPYCH
jgi:CheY-like chemotaxis protein